ncbi:hypothetical protein pmac_cds_923 [Pandoravirus macleodensis]|uniref:Uncharacterized protein n=1 Tax=Pandoravirus macleodensis TaxID=2107707 RepID=A0A2U7UI63_9VIRU|nr:hypothetical protein pmac_cds_923 [Pandoravirus macleodensis]AVK77611.1 hypothetical protein pmac_cds_923 [Pandoravirus macleodensis]
MSPQSPPSTSPIAINHQSPLPSTMSSLSESSPHGAMDKALEEAIACARSKAQCHRGLYLALHIIHCHFAAASRADDGFGWRGVESATAAAAVRTWRYGSFDEVCTAALHASRAAVYQSMREVLVDVLVRDVLLSPVSACGVAVSDSSDVIDHDNDDVVSDTDRTVAERVKPSVYRRMVGVVGAWAAREMDAAWTDWPLDALKAWFVAPAQEALRADMWARWKRARAAMRAEGAACLIRRHFDVTCRDSVPKAEPNLRASDIATPRAKRERDEAPPSATPDVVVSLSGSTSSTVQLHKKLKRSHDTVDHGRTDDSKSVDVARDFDNLVNNVINSVKGQRGDDDVDSDVDDDGGDDGDSGVDDDGGDKDKRVDGSRQTVRARYRDAMQVDRDCAHGIVQSQCLGRTSTTAWHTDARDRWTRRVGDNGGSLAPPTHCAQQAARCKRREQTAHRPRGDATRVRSRALPDPDNNVDAADSDDERGGTDQRDTKQRAKGKTTCRAVAAVACPPVGEDAQAAAMDADLARCMRRYRERFDAHTAVPAHAHHPDDSSQDNNNSKCDARLRWFYNKDRAYTVTDVVKDLLDAITRCAAYAHDVIVNTGQTHEEEEEECHCKVKASIVDDQRAMDQGHDVEGRTAPSDVEARRRWRAQRMYSRVFKAMATLGDGPLTVAAISCLPRHGVTHYALHAARYDKDGHYAPSMLPPRPVPVARDSDDDDDDDDDDDGGGTAFPPRSAAHMAFARWFRHEYVRFGYDSGAGADMVWDFQLPWRAEDRDDPWSKSYWLHRVDHDA